jgi:hypothetical protein
VALFTIGTTTSYGRMRADMAPEQVRAAGIYLNGGSRRGWKRRLSTLLQTPETTISAWSTCSAGNARPIPGVAAVAIKFLVAMMREELMVTAHPGQAAAALSERVAALLRQAHPFSGRKPDERPITVETPGWPAGVIQPPPGLGLQPPESDPIAAPEPEEAGSEIPFGFRGPAAGSGGRPGSSA